MIRTWSLIDVFVLHALQDTLVPAKGVHSSLGSAVRISWTFVDEEVAILIVFLVKLLHMVLTMSGLLRLVGGTFGGGILMRGRLIGLRRVPSMQASISGC